MEELRQDSLLHGSTVWHLERPMEMENTLAANMGESKTPPGDMWKPETTKEPKQTTLPKLPSA